MEMSRLWEHRAKWIGGTSNCYRGWVARRREPKMRREGVERRQGRNGKGEGMKKKEMKRERMRKWKGGRGERSRRKGGKKKQQR